MERGILQFDLPEDQEGFEDAVNGWRYKQCIKDLDEWLRHKDKHEDIEKVDVTEVRGTIYAIAERYGVEL